MSSKMNRRSFLATTAVVGAAGLVGGQLLTACSGKEKGAKPTPLREPGSYYLPELPDKAIDGRPLKCGLIGCGGRGNGAVGDLLNAANGITITALGDVFPDRVQSTREAIAKDHGQEVPAENCFTGFDAYQKVIDSGVDMVIVATPPVFRPIHFQYATSKGVHSFLEKPICVDAKGYRTIMATAKQAEAKGLSVVCGTQRHHQRPYVEAFRKIQEGLIGEITGGNVYWNQGMLWYRERQKGWSDMEWMIRDWVNWTWLSGDHIVEQHVHNIDVFNWMNGYKRPVRATAFGSRQRRPETSTTTSASISSMRTASISIACAARSTAARTMSAKRSAERRAIGDRPTMPSSTLPETKSGNSITTPCGRPTSRRTPMSLST